MNARWLRRLSDLSQRHPTSLKYHHRLGLGVWQEGDVLDSNGAQPKYYTLAVWTEVEMVPPGQSAAMIAVAGVRAPA
jgi:hypothetical protein